MKSSQIAFLPAIVLLVSCGDNTSGNTETETTKTGYIPALINYSVVKTYPHDTGAFTEGLLFHEGSLFESTGSPGDMPQTRSLFGKLDLSSGRIHKKVELDRTVYFGEGICFLGGKVYQLTYQHKKGFIYDGRSFNKIGEFKFNSEEGWGLTTDSTYLVMSDGTSELSYINPVDFSVVKKLSVVDEKGPVTKLNELEYINHFIYANVYGTSTVVKIDPVTGQVVARLRLNDLLNEAVGRYKGSMEMNGIAHDPIQKTTYITGKMWPILYEIRFGY